MTTHRADRGSRPEGAARSTASAADSTGTQTAGDSHMSPACRRMRSAMLKAMGITALAFMLSWLLVKPLSFSITSLFSSPEKDEFTIGDFYANVANRRPVRSLEDRMVIVDIGQMQRPEIARVLDIISTCGARAVGVDVMFAVPMEGDSTLIAAIAANSGSIVMPVKLRDKSDSDGERFEPELEPFFAGEVDGVRYGAVNLPAKVKGGTIREFATTFPMEGGGEMPSFAAAVVEMAYPEEAAGLHRRGNRLETIDYPSREYTVIPGAELIDRTEELIDKIVLVGALNDVDDMHAAPIDSYLSGVYIHAASIATILSGRYYSATPRVADWLLACCLCYIVALIGLLVDYRVKGLVNRTLQLVLVYVVVQIGYLLYINELIVINFTYALMMLTFGLFASDIWIGTHGLIITARDRRARWRMRLANG